MNKLVGFSVDLSRQCNWHWVKLFLEPVSWVWSVWVGDMACCRDSGKPLLLGYLYFETCVVIASLA